MNGLPYYDWEGRPITSDQWTVLLADERHIGLDQVGDVEVSTVYIGIDHGHGLSERPLIFESMLFGGDYDGWAWRYATEREARAGHAHLVAAVQEDREPSPLPLHCHPDA